jgi:hypothetical protein
MNSLGVISCVVICLWFAPLAWSQATAIANNVLLTGTIQEAAITESSGLVASRRFPGVFWTHNDAGSAAVLFAITKQGQSVGAFEVRGAQFNDLEDIAVDGSGNLYLADIGDNGGNRSTLFVHRLKEPNPGIGSRVVTVNRSWRLKFPGDRDDAESFVVLGENGYLITKPRRNGKVTIYTFRLSDAARTITLKKVGKISVAAPVTAADISPDGKRLGLVTENGVYVIFIDGNIGEAGSARRVFTRFANDAMEGGTFAGRGFLVSAETGDMLFFVDPAFNR